MPDPIQEPPKSSDTLPEGVKLQNDYKTDIDKYFDEPVAAPPAPVVEPKIEVKVEAPPPGSLVAKLAAKNQPPAPLKVETPVVPEDPVAKIEAEMKAHNPKWKPAQGWDQLKTTLKSEAERREKLEKEVNDLREKANKTPILAGMTADELEALKAREKSASDRLLVMDLESHPSFRAQFVEPKNAEVAKAQELLSVHGIKGDVASLLSKPRAELGKAVAELTKEMPDFDRVEVAEAIRRAYALEQGAKGALAQSKELQKNIQNKTVERQRDAFNRRWAPVSAALGEHILEIDVPPNATPEEKASIEAYNTEFKGLRSKAEAIAFSPPDEEGIAENAMKAAAYEFHIQRAMPRIISEYEQVVNLNRQLSEELKALRGRNPNHNIKATPSGADSPTSDPAKMDHAAAADHFFKK